MSEGTEVRRDFDKINEALEIYYKSMNDIAYRRMSLVSEEVSAIKVLQKVLDVSSPKIYPEVQKAFREIGYDGFM